MQVELVCDPAEAISRLTTLVAGCESMAWAVAWATENPVTDAALANKDKFRHLVVGTNQFITAPSVIERFMLNPTFRVQPHNVELFHPKVYCFDMGDHLVVVTGSHNLTRSAFSVNTEASAIMTGSRADPNLRSFFGFVEKCWRTGTRVDAAWLYGYRANHVRSRRLMKVAATWIDVKPSKAKADLPGMQDMDWERYVKEVTSDQIHGVEGRLQVLEKIRELLRGRSFADVPERDRKRVAGTLGSVEAVEAGLDWNWFGSMHPSPAFCRAVMLRANDLAAAMSAIPAEGGVDHEDYKLFVQRFMASFDPTMRGGGGIATATRLLAMKRPDQFVCLSSANKDGVCSHFGQPPSTTQLENYWERIIEPMRLSPWWRAAEPANTLERRIWRGRAAMLDAIHYVPSRKT